MMLPPQAYHRTPLEVGRTVGAHQRLHKRGQGDPHIAVLLTRVWKETMNGEKEWFQMAYQFQTLQTIRIKLE